MPRKPKQNKQPAPSPPPDDRFKHHNQVLMEISRTVFGDNLANRLKDHPESIREFAINAVNRPTGNILRFVTFTVEHAEAGQS